MSPKYQLNKEDGVRILKVLGWTVASSIIAVAITIINDIEVPMQYAFLLPLVNMGLVALQSFLRDNN
jgi:hypothetical protein